MSHIMLRLKRNLIFTFNNKKIKNNKKGEYLNEPRSRKTIVIAMDLNQRLATFLIQGAFLGR